MDQCEVLLRFRQRQLAQPCESFLAKNRTSRRCDLADLVPEGGRSRGLGREHLQRIRLHKHFVRVTQHAWPAKTANMVDDL